MKKSFNFILVGLGLFVVAVVGFVMLISGNGTQGAVLSAESMIQNASAGNLVITRQHLTIGYANSMAPAELKDLIDRYQIDEYSSVEWVETKVAGDNAVLNGKMVTTSGSTVDLGFSMTKSQGKWKISEIQRGKIEHSTKPMAKTAQAQSQPNPQMPETDTPQPNHQARRPQANVAADKDQPIPTNDKPANVATAAKPTKPNIPSLNEATDLVRSWTEKFYEAVNAKDFSDFHRATARDFRRQFSLTQFTEIFQPFIDRQIDLRWVKYTRPEFKRPPMVDAEGIVFLGGNFAGPIPLEFEYRFVEEKGTWKPLEVFLALKPAASQSLPDIDEIKNLVSEKTKAFGSAVHEQDFSEFHRKQLALPFRRKFPVGKFAEIFKEFVNERASLEWIAEIEPVFEIAPSLNTDGVLQTQGSFPTTPEVNFRYAFVQEESQWRLVFININVPEDDDTDKANASASNATSSERR